MAEARALGPQNAAHAVPPQERLLLRAIVNVEHHPAVRRCRMTDTTYDGPYPPVYDAGKAGVREWPRTGH